MSKVPVLASFLMAFFWMTFQATAQSQQGDHKIKQKVSKSAQKAAIGVEVSYQGAPHFVSIDGTSIYYPTNAAVPVLEIDGSFYFHFTYLKPYFGLTEGGTQYVWLVSASAQGPWAPARSVPEVALAIVCAPINPGPPQIYQLCALPWTW